MNDEENLPPALAKEVRAQKQERQAELNTSAFEELNGMITTRDSEQDMRPEADTELLDIKLNRILYDGEGNLDEKGLAELTTTHQRAVNSSEYALAEREAGGENVMRGRVPKAGIDHVGERLVDPPKKIEIGEVRKIIQGKK